MANSPAQSQLKLLEVAISITDNGIEMGVLRDGTPYLTERGLGRICDVSPSSISKQSVLWATGKRANSFAKILNEQGLNRDQLFIDVKVNGTLVHAYPDDVCMAFLEYYAFDAEQYCTEAAKANYRKLARRTLREFIYIATGYDPAKVVPTHWRQFHDRTLLNKVPSGYFSVFREISDMVICSIRAGLKVDDHTVPDISVGKIWSKYWLEHSLAAKYGERKKFPHTYPEYFPQAEANSVIEAYIYPLKSLGEFREWMQLTYLPEKFPDYLKRKAKLGALPVSSVELILAAVASDDQQQLT